jgi:hypothetical protein
MANERAINVSQATQIARSVKGQLTNLNGRLDEQEGAIESLTMRLSEAEALLNIARVEGGS